MIFFVCWAVFLVVLILAVIVAQLMGGRGDRSARSRAVAVAVEPSLEDDVAMVEGEESLEDPDAVQAFDEHPAEGEQPADDFAAFEEEFK